MEKSFYNGWKLSELDQDFLKTQFPPKYPLVRCEHVTLEVSPYGLAPPAPAPIAVVGYVDSGYMEVLLVEVHGMATRPAGGFYHITHSHEDGVRSREANDVILRFDHRRDFFYGITGEPFSRRRFKV